MATCCASSPLHSPACSRHLSKEELYWRVDLVTGALTHAMSDFGMIQRKSDVPEHQHREQTAEHLIRFAAAGLRSP